MPHCGDEQLDASFVATLSDESRRLLAEHGAGVDDFERRAVQQFAQAGEPATERR